MSFCKWERHAGFAATLACSRARHKGLDAANAARTRGKPFGLLA
jgi:hypothetical protein